MTILHLARRADWDAALRTGTYRVSTLGASLDAVGFVHASLPDQIAAVAEALYSGAVGDLCVLVLDESAVRAAGTEVRFEDGGDGVRYPHVYGAIDLSWVVDVRPAWFDEERPVPLLTRSHPRAPGASSTYRRRVKFFDLPRAFLDRRLRVAFVEDPDGHPVQLVQRVAG